MLKKGISYLNKLGQSVWYDDLSKELVDSGELQRLIDAGVSGLTSNPAIFKNSIADTNLYDKDIKELGSIDVEEVTEKLMLDDVAKAADLLLPVYEKSEGSDGYASVEISPFLADSLKESIEAGKRIWQKLDRPNIMIKVPATDAGYGVIEELLTEGINVNVTLIFSTQSYVKVIAAYKNALRKRVASKLPLNVSSVASFFISRVDEICNPKLTECLEEGKITKEVFDSYYNRLAILNAKLAYSLYLSEFSDFSDLEKLGARKQKPLWASTGSKFSGFPELSYVYALAGENTVNTMKPKTLNSIGEEEGFLNNFSSNNPIADGIDEAIRLIEGLEDFSFPYSDFLDKLLVDGLKSFSDSYQLLLDSVGSKIG